LRLEVGGLAVQNLRRMENEGKEVEQGEERQDEYRAPARQHSESLRSGGSKGRIFSDGIGEASRRRPVAARSLHVATSTQPSSQALSGSSCGRRAARRRTIRSRSSFSDRWPN